MSALARGVWLNDTDVRDAAAVSRGLLRVVPEAARLSTVSLRYGNVYGPRQDVHGEAGVVAIFWTSVIELLDALEGLGDRPLPKPRFEAERAGEVRRSCLDVDRASRELGWEAQVELRQGLRRILAKL